MDNNKKRYLEGCFCASWVDVEVTEEPLNQDFTEYRRKDLKTLLDELDEIKRNIEHVNEKKLILENLMRFNRGELAGS